MNGALSFIGGEAGLRGWVLFLVYLVVALLCVGSARRSAAPAQASLRELDLARSRRRFWLVLAAFLLLLGLIRQLDLSELAAQAMRGSLLAEDAYGERTGLQLCLIAAILSFGITGLLLALFTVRAQMSTLIALLAALVLAGFTVIRAISLHDIDQILAQQLVPYLPVDTLIEIGLLDVIVIAVFLFAHAIRSEQESARLRALSINERRRIVGEKRRSGRS